MASDNFLEALIPLVAAGGTLYAGMNNYRVGPEAFSTGAQLMNTARYWKTQEETERQHHITQLQHMGDAFARVGDVANAQRIDEQVRALGGQPGFAAVADALRTRMQRADQIIQDQMGGELALQPGPEVQAQTPDTLMPPGAVVMMGQNQGAGLPVQEPPTPMARPAGMPLTMPGSALNNLYGQIWDLDEQISSLPSGSDARGQAIDRSLGLSRQLPVEAVPPFPAAQDAENAARAAAGERIPLLRYTPDSVSDEGDATNLPARDLTMFMPPGSGVMAPQQSQPSPSIPEPDLKMPAEPSFPHPAQPRQAPAPFPGSINVDPASGSTSYNFTAEGYDRRQKVLVDRYYHDQVRRKGVPPLAAINALEQAGYGTYTEDLQKRAFNDTVASLTRTYVGMGMDVRIARQQALQQTLQAFPLGSSDADRTAAGQIYTADQHRIMEAEKQTMQGGKGVTQYLDEQAVVQAGKLAGEQADKRTRATNEAELDKPLELFPGGRAVWRKLDPGRYGEETVAPPSISNGRQAKESGFLNVSAFEKQLDTARGLSDIFNWTGQLEEYASEIIKAEPGFWNMTAQAARSTLAKWSNSDAPTSLKTLDGSRNLTLGEVVNLYERELRGSQDFITRALGTVGTQTEGDVMRSAKNFAGLADTNAVMKQLFHDLRSRVFARRMSLLSSAFGEKSVAEAFPRARRDWDGRGRVPNDYSIPAGVPGNEMPIDMEVSPGQPQRMGPAPQDPSKSKLDMLFEKAWVE